MKEINRFSIRSRDTVVRTIVRLSNVGTYHIDQFIYEYPDKINVNTGDIDPTSSSKNIHGAMDEKAYINWLTNALFNKLYSSGGPLEKHFMTEPSDD
jgi:hypothetical protein